MFLQPTVGFCWENFEMGLLMRITQVDYTYERWGTDIRYEPGIMIRGGSKNVKAMLQFRTDSGTNYSRSVAAHLPPENQVLYMPFHFSFGVHFDLNFSKEKTTGNALPHLVF